MIELVDAGRFDEISERPRVRIVDPRPPVRYLAGHIPRAVNFPASKLFDPKSLALKSLETLASQFGEIGVGDDSSLLLYDSYDGQNAAMLGWVLEYLGHRPVGILSHYIESWAQQGRELLYRPVKLDRAELTARPNPNVRATLEQTVKSDDKILLDLRSAREYDGSLVNEARAGHIPGAVNLPWTDLVGEGYEFLRPKPELAQRVASAGLNPQDEIVAYCNYGPRAAVGFVALQQLGYEKLRVFDGSFHQWALHPELPIKTEKPAEISGTQPGQWEAYVLPGC